jgi:hypothetical protein
VPHPGIIKKAPFDAHPARFSALPPVFPAQLLLTASGGFHSTSAADFPELAEPRLVDRAEPRANHLRRRIAPREGAAVSSSLRCNCGRLSANCPHAAGGEQPRCRPHLEPGNPRAGLRDWLSNMDPRRSKCPVSFRHRFVPEGYHRSNRAPERTGGSLDLLTCSRWSPHSDWYVTSLIQPWNGFARPHTGRAGGSKLLGNFAQHRVIVHCFIVRNSPPAHCFRCITKACDQIAAPSLCIGVFLLPKAMRPKSLLRAATNSLLVR